MIVLYGKFYVRKELKTEVFLKKTLAWISGMKFIPEKFKAIKYKQVEMNEIQDGANLVEYAIDTEQKTTAFCLKLENEKGELWRTDLVLQENEQQGIMQIRLAREQRRATAEQDANFRLPWILRQLLKEGYGGKDNELPVEDKPFFIDMKNWKLGAHCIMNADRFLMPIVYVSMPFYSDEYFLDVRELAVDLAGIAHVVVETDSSVTAKMKEETTGKNPYNGAVGIYYGKDDFVRITKNTWDNKNQFRWKVSHSVYARMAMLNIPEKQSISRITSNILLKKVHNNPQLSEKERKIQELEIQLDQKSIELEESKQELQEYVETFGNKEKAVYDLEAKVQYYQSVLESKKDMNGTAILLNYTEKEFYPEEIKDVLLELLNKIEKHMGEAEKKRRSYHVMQDIKACNTISQYRTEMQQSIREIIERRNVNERTIADLQRAGFEMKGNDHQKAYFHGDGRYMVTIASTPSEGRGGNNTAHDALDLLFK